jgi:2-polyprenyl-3-methyl-5-hydroxy-6-metoxy-1,4-benzoquinol methylase
MDNRENKYQYNYSEINPVSVYNRRGREQKAKTMLSVLQDFFGADLKPLTLLDVGSSTGIIANYLAMHFGKVVGIDIDQPAVEFATANFKRDNLKFVQTDSLKSEMQESYFDAVICAHVYEHVPDASVMMDEIHRLLKTGGVCYFAAGNRLNIMEPHHRLPFLSVIPRPLAHFYIRWAGKGKFYYEKHLSYWGLRSLVRKFELVDYTRMMIENPQRFSADYLLQPDAIKTKLARWVVKYAYWLVPGYIWLLKKV